MGIEEAHGLFAADTRGGDEMNGLLFDHEAIARVEPFGEVGDSEPFREWIGEVFSRMEGGIDFMREEHLVEFAGEKIGLVERAERGSFIFVTGSLNPDDFAGKGKFA